VFSCLRCWLDDRRLILWDRRTTLTRTPKITCFKVVFSFFLSLCVSVSLSVCLSFLWYYDKLYWLPIRERVKFKVGCLVRQSLFWQAPLYSADDCGLVCDSTQRSLRSADVPTCMVPQTLSSYSDRSFAATGPRLSNFLPVQLRNTDITYRLFRRQLKGHLFSGSMKTALCDF